jgi:hypothetical protein
VYAFDAGHQVNKILYIGKKIADGVETRSDFDRIAVIGSDCKHKNLKFPLEVMFIVQNFGLRMQVRLSNILYKRERMHYPTRRMRFRTKRMR